jgi:hypothetical protein
MSQKGSTWREGVTLLLRPELEDKVLRQTGPVMLVEVKTVVIVDMNLIVPMADGGRWGRVDYPARNAQHLMKPRRVNDVGNRPTVDDNLAEPDLYFDHQSSLLTFNPTRRPGRVENSVFAG